MKPIKLYNRIQHLESRYCNTLWQTQAFEIVFSQKYLETLKIRYLRSNDYVC
jgi:hypothetical protein